MTKIFNPYVKMVYDTDRPFSDFSHIPRIQVDELPNEIYEQGEYWITSDLADDVLDPKMREVFNTLKIARKTVKNSYPEILCSDILFDYPIGLRDFIDEKSKKREAVVDVAFRTDASDRLEDKGGQAYFEIYIGPYYDPRVDSILEKKQRIKAYEETDKKVESALRLYLNILKRNELKVKPGTSNFNLYEIVRRFFD